MTSTRVVACVAAVAGLLAACESTTETSVEYDATLSGSNEVPAVTSGGSGTFEATITSDNRLTYTLSFTGLSSNATMAHIHGPADATENAGVIVDFSSIPVALGTGTITLGATSGTGSGSLNLSANVAAGISGDSLRKLFNAGEVYVNVHTVTNGSGELRGQITRE
jgi:hypothetical protein